MISESSNDLEKIKTSNNRDENLKKLNQSKQETKQVSVKLTGQMAEVWSDLTKKSPDVSHSQLLKEAIKLRYLLALQKKENSDFYTDIELGRERISVSDFLEID